ncbi:MAG: hypothetical protein ROZ64_00955 [Burkholderiaceae bacterium]|nr:hypothetical protein [Burkholderiaceae bacterium]
MKSSRPARPAPLQSPRARDAAAVLPLLGLFAWMPPVIGLFGGSARVFGIPLIVAWLFGVWLALIALALWFSRRLDSVDDASDADSAGAEHDETERSGH